MHGLADTGLVAVGRRRCRCGGSPASSARVTASVVSSGGTWKTPKPSCGISTSPRRGMFGTWLVEKLMLLPCPVWARRNVDCGAQRALTASQPAPRFGADTLGVSVDSNGHRVLVVDDEPNIVDVVTMALRFQGFAVESAGNGGAGARPPSPPSTRTSSSST